jgi:hypothetical protein
MTKIDPAGVKENKKEFISGSPEKNRFFRSCQGFRFWFTKKSGSGQCRDVRHFSLPGTSLPRVSRWEHDGLRILTQYVRKNTPVDRGFGTGSGLRRNPEG